MQLCVENDERAGTILAVSKKWLYAPLLTPLLPNSLFFQILLPLCRLCTLQTCRGSFEHALCGRVSSNQVCRRRWDHVDRPRYCEKSRTRWEHGPQEVESFSLRVCNALLFIYITSDVFIAFWGIQGTQSHLHAHGFQTFTCQHPVPYHPWVSTFSPLAYLTLEVVHSAIDARLDVVDGKFRHPLNLVSYISSQSS